jgi:hypothetical protein
MESDHLMQFYTEIMTIDAECYQGMIKGSQGSVIGFSSAPPLPDYFRYNILI